jgi:hypothetical protein
MKYLFYVKEHERKPLCAMFTQGIRIMKLTAILIVIFTLGVQAASKAQQVTLSLKNSTLKAFFAEVEKQTIYEFLYNDELLQKYSNISLNIKNATVEEALNPAFSGTSLFYKSR